MGKKGSLFSAIARVFAPKKSENELKRKNTNDKAKKKKANLETNSFLPIFRQPSSIEKILGDAEREHNIIFPPRTSPERSNTSTTNVPPVRPTSPRAASPRDDPPRAASSMQQCKLVCRPEPAPALQHASALKIQSAFRGYMARRSFKALRGLARLQGVTKGHGVKRQTTNAMRHMQLLVRVQTQIQSRRIQMLENRSRHNHKEESKWVASLASEAGNENWDDSVLTKEEKDARLVRKFEAMLKRERSMAYAYSHQLWKSSPKSAQAGLTGIGSGGFHLWWNWMDRQLPLATPTPKTSQPVKDFWLTPTRQSPQPRSSRQSHVNSRGRATDSRFKDDESLTSCPPFTVPNYMVATVSAKAKVRPSSNPKERVMGTASNNSEKRRMSYPVTRGLGTFKWNRGSLVMNNNSNKGSAGSTSGVVLEKHKTPRSIGDLSIDSTVSMPATSGRKPFNRFA